MTFNISTGGTWAVVGMLIGILSALQWCKGWISELRQLVDLLRTARDEEREARLKAEKQRDELLARYAQTTAQVISALPVPTPPAPDPGAQLQPGGDPGATVAA